MSAGRAQGGIGAAGTDAAGKMCTICQTVIVAGEEAVSCPDCGLPFHQECWDENRGCSQYGCKSAPATVKADAPDMVSTGWAGEKKCPSCRRTIKAQAIKCRFCGAVFDTREEISEKEFSSREYTGSEYTSSRNKVVALFLVAASGCLAPIALVMLSLLVFKGRALGVEYRRLSPALRALAVCGMVAGCFLLFLMVVLLVFDGGR